ncbi:MAG: hypothetical protein AB4352_26450 [Hormoscilla sp.]
MGIILSWVGRSIHKVTVRGDRVRDQKPGFFENFPMDTEIFPQKPGFSTPTRETPDRDLTRNRVSLRIVPSTPRFDSETRFLNSHAIAGVYSPRRRALFL